MTFLGLVATDIVYVLVLLGLRLGLGSDYKGPGALAGWPAGWAADSCSGNMPWALNQGGPPAPCWLWPALPACCAARTKTT